ncbi:MAG: hypothetical protein RI556_11960 [Hydrogenovibrio sp.]|uniref:hypothetical protein n=1 Tax=Hydrogenovibrio sp. TaxID=2065821 RepID=UPI002870B27C|nr:hypothetical protein [Hydrogenovibrio sp.]MDR9499882.1 hypothetical protein [Hydrogenovibrio sp.]
MDQTTNPFPFSPVILMAISALFLSACGGGSSGSTSDSDTSSTVNYEGRVIDGYIRGATVCLDTNRNRTCDDGEPQAQSGGGGYFNIRATAEEIEAFPIIVNASAGTAFDEGKDEYLQADLNLMAPPNTKFVTPVTTMVQQLIDEGETTDNAETLVAQTYSIDRENLYKDYEADPALANLKDKAYALAEEIQDNRNNFSRVFAASVVESDKSEKKLDLASIQNTLNTTDGETVEIVSDTSDTARIITGSQAELSTSDTYEELTASKTTSSGETYPVAYGLSMDSQASMDAESTATVLIKQFFTNEQLINNGGIKTNIDKIRQLSGFDSLKNQIQTHLQNNTRWDEDDAVFDTLATLVSEFNDQLTPDAYPSAQAQAAGLLSSEPMTAIEAVKANAAGSVELDDNTIQLVNNTQNFPYLSYKNLVAVAGATALAGDFSKEAALNPDKILGPDVEASNQSRGTVDLVVDQVKHTGDTVETLGECFLHGNCGMKNVWDTKGSFEYESTAPLSMHRFCIANADPLFIMENIGYDSHTNEIRLNTQTQDHRREELVFNASAANLFALLSNLVQVPKIEISRGYSKDRHIEMLNLFLDIQTSGEADYRGIKTVLEHFKNGETNVALISGDIFSALNAIIERKQEPKSFARRFAKIATGNATKTDQIFTKTNTKKHFWKFAKKLSDRFMIEKASKVVSTLGKVSDIAGQYTFRQNNSHAAYVAHASMCYLMTPESNDRLNFTYTSAKEGKVKVPDHMSAEDIEVIAENFQSESNQATTPLCVNMNLHQFIMS